MYIKTKEAKTKLQIIATPIGNMKELCPRALKAIEDCQTILCEDTRVTNKLLTYFKIKNKELISFQKHNENQKQDLALEKILKSQTILVSDAGYPCISDPGYGIVNTCHKNNIAVEVINGPSSIMHALAACGININNFYFNGFLNASNYQRVEKLKQLQEIKVPIILFESVYRIKKSLLDIKKHLNDPYVIVCRELTKMNETFYFGQIDEIINEIIEKGEFIIIVKPKEKKIKSDYSEKELISLIQEELKSSKLKDACKKISNNLYNRYTSTFLYNLFLKKETI